MFGFRKGDASGGGADTADAASDAASPSPLSSPPLQQPLQPAAVAAPAPAAASAAAATATGAAAAPPALRFEVDLQTSDRLWQFGCADPFSAAEWVMFLRLAQPAHVDGVRRAMAQATAAQRPLASLLARPDVRGSAAAEGATSNEAHPVPSLWTELPSNRGSSIADSLAAGVA